MGRTAPGCANLMQKRMLIAMNQRGRFVLKGRPATCGSHQLIALTPRFGRFRTMEAPPVLFSHEFRSKVSARKDTSDMRCIHFIIR